MNEEAQSWASSAAVRASMQSNKGRDTAPELALRRELHSRGLRFFVNRRPLPALRRTADIVFPRMRLAVFVDGCFWHGCPTHHTVSRTNSTYWADKVATNVRRDEETNELLQEAGWTVIRVWEHMPVREAADEIAAFVRDSRPSTQKSRPGR